MLDFPADLGSVLKVCKNRGAALSLPPGLPFLAFCCRANDTRFTEPIKCTFSGAVTTAGFQIL